jgi:hypothetical protein
MFRPLEELIHAYQTSIRIAEKTLGNGDEMTPQLDA